MIKFFRSEHVKKTGIILLIVCTIILVGCGDEQTNRDIQDTETPQQPEQEQQPGDSEDEETISSNGYEAIEQIDIDGYANGLVFTMSADGTRLIWGETDQRLANTKRANLWIEGETRLLDFPDDNIDYFFLSEQGNIIRNQADWDLPVEERHAIIVFNPETEETIEHVMNNDWDTILTPSRTNYSEEPHMYIRYKDYSEQVTLTFWDITQNEVQEIDLTDLVYSEEDEELHSYPRTAFIEDTNELILLIFDVGIVRYDLDSSTGEFVFTTDNLFAHNERSQTPILTYDNRYALYATFDAEDDMTHMAFDLETEEELEIGMGVATFPLQDGTVILFDYDDTFQHFDPSTGDLSEIHAPDLSDGDSIDNFTISADGSTIAYVVRDDDNESTLYIVSLF
ncbi:hypothetical protein SAMN04488134_102265 [Amphibacillus marinus]|uniref:WD40-like Beta Propeller Repeat n=1 Tax=Amphibacillus marinus TaxID=872970 RepID=A0A1H8KEE2_9BACI|nr:hypothetical protein [Amphibacillus marinus]SEN91353.1 hypothetical protein SAMN04488134_102265 [Amphibacillus marinus]